MSETAAAPAAPATTNPAPTVAPPTAPVTAPAAPAAPADWVSGLSEDLRGYVQAKGFKDPGTVVDSYRNLEKFTGAPPERIVKLPERPDDSEAWNNVYTRLGRPAKPEEYGIKPQNDAEKAHVDITQKIFHEAGLSTRQAELLNTKMNDYAKGLRDQAQKDQQMRATSEQESLKKEWGAAFDQNINLGREAAKTFGLTPEMIDKMESSVGYSQVMKLFQNIGSKLGEGNFVSGQGAPGRGILTPDAAKYRIEELKQDKLYMRQWLQEGDAAKKLEMEQLHKWAYPEPQPS